jgi:hypothetical protein
MAWASLIFVVAVVNYIYLANEERRENSPPPNVLKKMNTSKMNSTRGDLLL